MSFPIGEILFLVFLTFLEGFFVAAEIALVSVRRSRIDQLVEEGNGRARRVRKLLDDPGRFLAVAQIGLTMIGFFASAFAAISLADGLQHLLEGFGMEAGAAGGTALVVVTIILALFTIVFAELIPKSIALAAPERFALALSRPIDVIARVLGPVVTVMSGITRWVARSIGVDINQEAQISADELRLIVERGGEQGILEAEEEQMINAVIELGERRVHEVMIPRVAIAAVSSTATLEEAIDLVIEVGHSRIPVYHDSIDVPKSSASSSTATRPSIRISSSDSRTTISSSTSYSSWISPTISSSRSSIETRPAVPPYSSRTIAMWTFLRWKSWSRSSIDIDSGAKTGVRRIDRIAGRGPAAVLRYGNRSLAYRIPTISSIDSW